MPRLNRTKILPSRKLLRISPFLPLFLAMISASNYDAYAANSLETLSDYEAYSSGHYLAYAAPFNKGSFIYGKNYTENITLMASLFPAQSSFTWNWPNIPCSAGVYSFIAIDYGDYYDTVVQEPIASKQISNINSLVESHIVSYSGSLQDYDVIDDIFLTTRPGNNSTNYVEIEVFLHTPAYSASYVQSSRQIGTFIGSGVTWIVAISESGANTPDILFMPKNKADLANRSIDLTAMFQYLVSSGLIPNSLYFNGFALGTETRQGQGSIRISSFSVTYN